MVWTHDATNHLAKSLETLYNQINQKWPVRDRTDDGTIGDERHQATHSEHNPDAHHLVRALDIDHDPPRFDAHGFAEYLRTHPDPRLQYIISNGRIANGDIQNWAWRPYNGENPHNHHIHLTVRENPTLADDPKPWLLDGAETHFSSDNGTKSVTLPRLHKGSVGGPIEKLQRALKLPIDDKFGDLPGIFGSETEAAVVTFQEKNQLGVDGWVGPSTWGKLGIIAEVQADQHNILHEDHSNLDIIATRFGGTKDPNTSAYDNHFITDTEIGASLPFRFANRPKLWVKGPNGYIVNDVPLVDVGPLYPSFRGPADPYWETGARPRGEIQKVLSQAGIDLTPALADKLGITEQMGKGKVTWGFMSGDVVVSQTKPKEIPVSDQGENTPSQNEPGGEKKPDVVVVQPTTTTAGQQPDWGSLIALAAPLVISMLQPKSDGSTTSPPVRQDDLTKLITAGAPILFSLFKGGTGGTAAILPAVLAAFGTVTKSPEAMSGLDKLLGGEATKGKKTAFGVITLLGSLGLQLAGVMDPITTGSTTSILSTLIPLGITILGGLAKIDRKVP